MAGDRVDSKARWLAKILIVAIAYHCAARLGLLLAFEDTNASPVWPPSGIALAAVILLGYRVWPGVFLGAFTANVYVFLANQPGAPPLPYVEASIFIGAGNTLEAVAGAYLVRRFIGSKRFFHQVRNVFKFVAVALSICLVSAVVGPTTLLLMKLHSPEIYTTVFLTWWMGDIGGVIVFAPMLLAWSAHLGREWSMRGLAETLVWLALFVGAGLVLFGGFQQSPILDAVHYLILPVLIWAAYRYQQHEVFTAVAIVSGIAVFSTVEGVGPFARESTNDSLLLLLGFVCVIAVTCYAISANIVERKQALQELRIALGKVESSFENAIAAISTIVEKRDPYTSGHQRRVAQLASAIGERLGLDGHQITGLRLASLVHDIGKLHIPSEILSRPGALGRFEQGFIRDHPFVAYEVLKEVDFPWPVAAAVYQHHERLDGSGYPQGLRGGDIIVEAKIIGVADVVESISSFRPYRPARGLSEALDEIERNKDTLYDGRVVDACLALFGNGGFSFEESPPPKAPDPRRSL